MSEPRKRAILVEILSTVVAKIGSEVAIPPDWSVKRTYAGRRQLERGAWSWRFHTELQGYEFTWVLDVGSQFTQRAVVQAYRKGILEIDVGRFGTNLDVGRMADR